LVRHGEATSNAAGLLLGRTDVPLTEHGAGQAAALAASIDGVAEVRSSPLRRALDTAESFGLPVTVDDRWVEVDYGELEGRPLAEVPGEVWRRWRADPSFRPAGGESLAAVGERVGAACDELFATPGEGARRSDGAVVVVSHVSPIKAAVAWALRSEQDVAWRLHLSTGSATRIDWSPAGFPVLQSFNERFDGATAG